MVDDGTAAGTEYIQDGGALRWRGCDGISRPAGWWLAQLKCALVQIRAHTCISRFVS